MFKHWTLPDMILSDSQIRQAIEAGDISGSFDDKQIQPASLDLKASWISLYDAEVQAGIIERVNAEKGPVELDRLMDELPESAKKYATGRVVVPPGAIAEIGVDLESKIHTTVDLRSSRGRAGLRLQWPTIRDGVVTLTNENPNPIALYIGDRFAQAFFHAKTGHGAVVTDYDEVEAIAREVFTGSAAIYGAYVVFTAGGSCKRSREEGVIDTREKNAAYDDIPLHEPVVLQREDTIVLPLREEMRLPANLGIQLLPYMPTFHPQGLTGPWTSGTLFGSVRGGWVDPGYEGRVTAHPFAPRPGAVLREGKPIAFGRFYRFSEEVDRAYGSKDLDSHYQGSSGSVSRD